MSNPEKIAVSSSATREELAAGLMMFAGITAKSTGPRTNLIQTAMEANVFNDIDERAWLCHKLGLDFGLDLSNAELVQLGIDHRLDFGKS